MTAGEVPPVGEVSAELRALAEVLLDRLEPWLVALAAPSGSAAAGEVPSTCSWCPVCALVAALRGERPELARRLAEQGGGVLTAVRALLDEHGQHGEHAPSPQPEHTPAAPRVVPIAVRRR